MAEEHSSQLLAQVGGSLGRELDSFLGDLGDVNLDSRASQNWERWLSTAQGPQAEDFTSALSVAQYNSHRIFCELWNDLSDRRFLQTITQYFKEAASSNNGDGEDAVEASPELPRLGSGPDFYKVIFDLFVMEFFCKSEFDETNTFISMLHGARQEAAMYMASARLSRRCLATRIVSEDAAPPGGISSWKRSSAAAGASIQPCPWLADKPTAESLPYYLWDRLEKQTIAVNSLSARPEYIAVSHTWGRWKTSDPPVQLHGTPRWSIPQNSRFRVQDLPEILEGIPLPQRYVWLDLLCIPQDRSELSQTEISRQATIFREASVAVMWLNDIERWDSLPAIVEWLCVRFLEHNDMISSDGSSSPSRAAPLSASPISSLELVAGPSPEDATPPGSSNSDLNPWFTSLWTLQEICLRPDMLLASKSWALVTAADNPTTFDEIVALEHAMRKSNPSVDDGHPPPPGVALLSSLLLRTGLSGLGSMSRPTVLGLATHRSCLERRAEAIMAVLDATDWFAACGGDDAARERDLVLGQFPLAFVREVQQKLGPATFFASDSVQPFFFQAMAERGGGKEEEEEEEDVIPAADAVATPTAGNDSSGLGSLLPFGKGLPKFYQSVVWDSGMTPHQSTRSWVVQKSGCVSIPEAVVVASTAEGGGDAVELPAVVFAPVVGPLVSVQHVDLRSWAAEHEPEFNNYAVCLSQSSLGTTGVLLKELSSGVLVKIGTYFQDRTPGYVLPEQSTVNWLVL